MVQGVDVWLNTPTRPLEASGTSGEKCVMNGVLQFSVLDGWWVEGYKEGAGWALPMERTFADQRFQDELDAEMIYNTIEEQIVPLYYKRDEQNIPRDWVESVKRCVADIAANFTTNRMMRDYEERFYGKLAARRHEIVAGDYMLAREIAAWKRRISAAWDKVRIVEVKQAKIDREAMFVGGALPLRDQDRRGRPPSRRHRRRAGRGQADRVRPAGQRDRNRTARTHGRRGDDRHLRARLPFGPLGVVRRGAAHLPPRTRICRTAWISRW